MIKAAASTTTSLPWWVLPGLCGILVLMFLGVWIIPKFRSKCVSCGKKPHASGSAWCEGCIIASVAKARLQRHKDQAGDN